uniref:Uncharacterized protein n=1 Tax=Setaria digitata TaxID=48799 RepID=A0A915Q6F1_9BILA
MASKLLPLFFITLHITSAQLASDPGLAFEIIAAEVQDSKANVTELDDHQVASEASPTSGGVPAADSNLPVIIQNEAEVNEAAVKENAAKTESKVAKFRAETENVTIAQDETAVAKIEAKDEAKVEIKEGVNSDATKAEAKVEIKSEVKEDDGAKDAKPHVENTEATVTAKNDPVVEP